ncbi:hypothetical protein IAD21_05136 [Abditibacteriota bacterium]|nr:hypothetical protein IAD21_05136 [Abditibacteriota bacterium]
MTDTVMKSILLVSGALFLSAPVFAQGEAQTAPQIATEPSGYDLLVQAGQKILSGPNGGASNTDPNIPPEENLRRERLAVARNAPALALVRLALQKPVEIPEVKGPILDIHLNAKARELARQFSQESDVRFADGDYKGAMDSRLDTLELGTVVGHGMLISMLVGVAIESIGNKGTDKIGAHLTAAQCREVIARLSKIEERRTSLAETLRHEQKYTLNATLETFKPGAIDEMKPADDGTFPTAQDIAEFKALTPEQLTKSNARLFDAVVEAAQLPYPKSIGVALPQDLDPFTKLSFDVLQNGRYRFSYDRTVSQTRLLSAALELRALKLETGNYPERFTAPVDPFAGDAKPLVYRKADGDYLLYSLGPDGKDDGGAEIQTLETREETGIKTVSDRLQPNSTGDIVQTPF